MVLEVWSVSHYSSGSADCDSIVRDVLSDYGSCSDQCVLANRHARDDRGARADRRMTLHKGLEKFPFSMRSRMFVICERHVRRDEHVVLNGYACRYEDEWANLAIIADRHSFLNVDVRVNLRVFSDIATVKVYLIVNTRPIADTGLFDYRVSRPSHLAKIFSSIGTSTGTVRS